MLNLHEKKQMVNRSSFDTHGATCHHVSPTQKREREDTEPKVEEYWEEVWGPEIEVKITCTTLIFGPTKNTIRTSEHKYISCACTSSSSLHQQQTSDQTPSTHSWPPLKSLSIFRYVSCPSPLHCHHYHHIILIILIILITLTRHKWRPRLNMQLQLRAPHLPPCKSPLKMLILLRILISSPCQHSPSLWSCSYLVHGSTQFNVNRRYTLMKSIGHGAYGVVWYGIIVTLHHTLLSHLFCNIMLSHYQFCQRQFEWGEGGN